MTWLTTTCFIVFALSGVPLISLYFTDRYEVTSTGISFRTIFGVRKNLRWTKCAAFATRTS